MVSVRTEKAAKNYSGETARNYEARRTPQVKWKREQEILEGIIKGLPDGTEVLDIPIGTGRLLPFFAQRRGFDVTGVDISEDMLDLAVAKAQSLQSQYASFRFWTGNILKIALPDDSKDVTFAIRIMNKIGVDDVPAALKELQRVTREKIVFNLRIPGKEGMRHPVPMEVIEGALEPGWRIAEDIEIHEPTFRMITLRRE